MNMVNILIALLLAAGAGLFIGAGMVRRRGVEEEFVNEKGVVRIKVNIKNEKYNRLAGKIYTWAVICLLAAFLLAFGYYGFAVGLFPLLGTG